MQLQLLGSFQTYGENIIIMNTIVTKIGPNHQVDFETVITEFILMIAYLIY